MAATTRVRVVVRSRPLLRREREAEEEVCVCVDTGSNAVLLRERFLDVTNAEMCRESVYAFDAVYDEGTSQKELFAAEAQPLINNLFKGRNSTIFAFGMTGTGKSYTMAGSARSAGLVPRSVAAILRRVASGMGSLYTRVRVSFQFLELYKDKAYDLLVSEESKTALPLWENQQGQVVVARLSEATFETQDEFMAMYDRGLKHRHTASTKLNGRSSRSHSMAVLRVEAQTRGRQIVTGKLHLIDLAGNEDNRHSGNVGVRMQESQKINRDLFALGNVIKALNNGSPHVPYRESKLTRLLQDSLGGHNMCVMVCCIAPGERFSHFTERTLTYGAAGRRITNTDVAANVQAMEEEEDKDDEEIDRRAQLEAWRAKKGKKKQAEHTPDHNTRPTKKRRSKKKKTDNEEDNKEELMDLTQVTPHITRIQQPDILRKLESLASDVTKITAMLENQQQRFDPKPEPLLPPLTPVSLAQQAKTHVASGKELEEGGKLSEAIQEFEKAAKLLPNNEKLERRIAKLRSQLMQERQDTSERLKENVSRTMQTFVRSSLVALLNTATVKQLQQLHLIGKKRAEAIVAYRSQGFRALLDLREATGMSEKQVTQFLAANSTHALLH